MTTALKLYGLPRTCTNVVAYLVERNLDGVRVWHHEPGRPDGHTLGAPGWKHGAPTAIEGMRGYLLCVKDPLAWLRSIDQTKYRGPYVAAVALWNERGRQFLAFLEEHPAMLIRHRDVLASPGEVVGAVAYGFRLGAVREPLDVPALALDRNGDHEERHRVLPTAFDPARYEPGCVEADVPAEAQEAVRRGVDRAVAHALGCEVS